MMRSRSRSLLRLLFVLSGVFGALQAQADVFVIVHRDNPLPELASEHVASLYLGRARSFSTGDFAVVFDQHQSGKVRERFVRLLLGMSLPQVNAYWARLSFTGRVTPPDAREDDEAVIAAVAQEPLAIGYVESRPADPRVRVVLRLEE